ncbi:hypothetical protein [Bdellovibrio svalbardensis]|uniref:C-type lysozyme inhibitor domain-containing protein n=1 Tax=Bdellovibrio svalbardensis TaxID=2972972 RepID=A0ABT6DFZ1_9BACT|nr:hypothetical protein [Bdellovibrio svalbardensis]MDG0815768.1 hypothetical protein [Bdellovibrio svalbardensis]
MKSLKSALLLGCVFTVPKMALAAGLPQCTIDIKDQQGHRQMVVDLQVQTYPQSDLASYVFRDEVEGAQVSISTCDGNYIASVRFKNGFSSSTYSQDGVNLEAGSETKSLSIVCP